MHLSLKQFALLCSLLTCVTGRVARFSYVGCFQDGDNSHRDLNGLGGLRRLGPHIIRTGGTVHNLENMSHEFCSSVCSLGGFPYFGVQVGKQCFCGTSYGLHGSLSESQCNSQCTGNPLQKCGGFARNSVFALTYPNNNVYTVLNQSDVPLATSEYSAWPSAAQSDVDCLIQCSARADCQGAAFSQQLLTCRLLEFAYPPASLNGPLWTVFIKS